jgi:hypothetical protein
LRLDGSRAAANTITQTRGISTGTGYAVEAGLLGSNLWGPITGSGLDD